MPKTLELGRGDDFSFEPYCDGGELHEAHEVGEQLVVSGGNVPEVLELAKEALDSVAFSVEMFVVEALDLGAVPCAGRVWALPFLTALVPSGRVTVVVSALPLSSNPILPGGAPLDTIDLPAQS